MAEEEGVLTNLDTGTSGEPKPNGADTLPAVGIITQYVKDLSVENPSAPDVYQWSEQPQIDVQFNIGAEPVGNDVHEVMLKLTLTAASQRGTMYMVDLAYCGLVGMRNVCSVVADAVRDAGFPPLLVDPIDFNGLYAQQLSARRAEEAAGGEPIKPVTGNA